MRIASDDDHGILLRDGLFDAWDTYSSFPMGYDVDRAGKHQGFKVRVRDVQLVARVASRYSPFVSVISEENFLSAVAGKLQNVTSKEFSGWTWGKAENEILETVRHPKRGKKKLMIGHGSY